MKRFAIKIDPLWRAPMLLIGATRTRAYVEVDSLSIRIHFGMAHEEVPLSNIAEMVREEWSLLMYGLGVRIGPNGIAYVGSTRDVVLVKLREKQAFRVLFKITMQFAGVSLSLEDPEGFMRAVNAAIADLGN